MAMSLSFRETGSDESNDDVVDICSYCATQDKLQPATHFCFDCGVYGRYICGICERNHKMFLGGHETIYIGSQTNIQRNQRNNQQELLELKKKYHEQETHLKQQSEELERRQKRIQKLENELKDLNTKNQRSNQQELLELKKKYHEQETHLKQQNEELERRQKHIQKLENELKDLNTKNQEGNQKEVLELKKKYHEQEVNLEQQNEELERRQKHIQTLENEIKDLNTKMQMYMTDQNEVLKLKKEIREQEIRLQEQKELLETKTKDIQKLKNEVKDIKSFNSVWTINAGCDVKDTKLLVAAIEIGITFTKVGFCAQHDYERDSLIVRTIHHWQLSRITNGCIPTVVLFDENKQFHSFGYEAEDRYSDLASDNEHHKWYFYKNFTIELNEDKTELTDINGKKMNTVRVFGAVIKYLKDYLLGALRDAGTDIQNKEIHWVLPVPNRWTMFTRQIIQQASYTAGIAGEQLTIVSEAEVCSLYCEVAPMTVDSNEVRQAITHSGTKYMVIYLEEDTAGITVYERQADGGIMELYKVSSKSCCGTNVDEEFYRLLKSIFGDSVFQKFMNENLEDYLELQHNFVTTKRTVTPNSNGKITVKVPVAISETYKGEMGKTIKDAIEGSPYSGKIDWRVDKMRNDAQVLKDLFKPCTDKIVGHIQDLLKQPDVQGTNIFLMVGGFSESEMVQDAILKSLPSGKVIIPDKASQAVLKGAVIYGHRYLKEALTVVKWRNGQQI